MGNERKRTRQDHFAGEMVTKQLHPRHTCGVRPTWKLMRETACMSNQDWQEMKC